MSNSKFKNSHYQTIAQIQVNRGTVNNILDDKKFVFKNLSEVKKIIKDNTSVFEKFMIKKVDRPKATHTSRDSANAYFECSNTSCRLKFKATISRKDYENPKSFVLLQILSKDGILCAHDGTNKFLEQFKRNVKALTDEDLEKAQKILSDEKELRLAAKEFHVSGTLPFYENSAQSDAALAFQAQESSHGISYQPPQSGNDPLALALQPQGSSYDASFPHYGVSTLTEAIPPTSSFQQQGSSYDTLFPHFGVSQETSFNNVGMNYNGTYSFLDNPSQYTTPMGIGQPPLDVNANQSYKQPWSEHGNITYSFVETPTSKAGEFVPAIESLDQPREVFSEQEVAGSFKAFDEYFEGI